MARKIALPVSDPINQIEEWLHCQKKTASQSDPANGYEFQSRKRKSYSKYLFYVPN